MRYLTVSIFTMLFIATILIVSITPMVVAEDITIPLGVTDRLSNNIVGHLTQVIISTEPRTSDYNFVGDPKNYLWPTLVYYYENVGNQTEKGRIELKFIDDHGDEYPVSDPGTMAGVKPGGKSEDRLIAVAIPKDRKVVKLVVILGSEEISHDLNYPSTAATPAASVSASAQAISPSPSGQQTSSSTPSSGLCAGSWVLPLLIGGTIIASAGVRRGRNGKN
ncbi:MAG TPA: hypothetical protein VK436_03320 [Methanocella sp.]|nr:hypothetical protein [Methanocella sp.]